MGIEVTELTSAADDGFAVLAETYRADMAVRDPGDPVPSDVYIDGEFFFVPPDRQRQIFAATLDGRPAGYVVIHTQSTSDDEIRLAQIDVAVLEDERRKGVGTALMARAAPAAAEMDQNSIIGYSALDLWTEAGEGFCESYGLTKRQEERCSRTVVADIDRSLLDGWIADAASKAEGYRIEQWEGVSPDHLAAAWCTAAAAMEDAPLDDVDFDPQTRAPEAQQAADEAIAQSGFRVYRSLALGPGDEPAGMSDLSVGAERPEVGHQGDTGVLTAHRGHGLGRWLKAANFYQSVAAHPELSVIETYNAQSNPWMLDINVAMGFKPHHLYVAYQAPLETVAAAVEAKEQG